MKSHEFIDESRRPSPGFINSQVNKKLWKKVGSGTDVSVWQHINDSDTVVKIVGGGKMPVWKDGTAVIMFANFCVDHAATNKHLPKVLAINTDDPEVCQIRVERLLPLPGDSNNMGYHLEQLAKLVSIGYYGNADYVAQLKNNVQEEMNELGLDNTNSLSDLISTIRLVVDSAGSYAKKFGIAKPLFDVHSDNWMMRPDRTIVLSDPWH